MSRLTECPRCKSEDCHDPDSKACSNNCMARYRADLEILCTIVRTGAVPPKREWTSDTVEKTAMRAVEQHRQLTTAPSPPALPEEPRHVGNCAVYMNGGLCGCGYYQRVGEYTPKLRAAASSLISENQRLKDALELAARDRDLLGVVIRAACRPSEDLLTDENTKKSVGRAMELHAKLMSAEASAQAAQARAGELERDKDEAYRQRNHLVAGLARLYPSGIRRTDIEGWSDDWHGCCFIDLPSGQISYHYHDSHAYLFADLPPYDKPWDGHDKETVHQRIAALKA